MVQLINWFSLFMFLKDSCINDDIYGWYKGEEISIDSSPFFIFLYTLPEYEYHFSFQMILLWKIPF